MSPYSDGHGRIHRRLLDDGAGPLRRRAAHTCARRVTWLSEPAVHWLTAGPRVQLGILAVLRGRLDEARHAAG